MPHLTKAFFYCLFIIFLFSAAFNPAYSSSQTQSLDDSNFEKLQEKLKQGKTGKFGVHFYWDEGINVESPDQNFMLTVGGQIGLDLGHIESSGDVTRAFSDFDGFNPEFRRLQMSTYATVYKVVDIKLEIDFANVQTIKDIWFRYTKTPFLKCFKLGHQKEPFSLERLASFINTTFMERSLPTFALAPGRDIGLSFADAAFNNRFTFAVGLFWNTGSIQDVKDPQDSISEANGYNIAARVSGLPWYENEGRRLLHLGLAYNHGPRNSGEDDAMRVSTFPESYIAKRTLVDTEEFFADNVDRFNLEFATVSGPLSFQGEGTFYIADSDSMGSVYFWGHYLYVSYFFTGEHRTYDTLNGIFSLMQPKNEFSFREKRWGALEVALRHSFVDLNDDHISGGRERNFTFAVNWYLKRKMRVLFNYVRADVADRNNSVVIDKGSADIFQTRFQIRF